MSTSFSSSPLDCSGSFRPDVRGKTAVITGGASGIGEAYTRALHAAGCVVVIGDRDAHKGGDLSSQLAGTKFVSCDVTSWDDQARLFKEAAEFSPTGKIHYVIANAGIFRSDGVFQFDGVDRAPEKPDLSIVNVNLHGTLYTTKLAMHYFISQNGTQPHNQQDDTCLILISSGAGFLDVPRTPQYCSTKWAVRGIMHSLRRTAHYYGSRVNVISPWYIRTGILAQDDFDRVQGAGVDFATAEDAGQCALRILSDKTINGKSLFVCPRKWAPQGYMDLDLEDYRDSALLSEIQDDQIKNAPVELGLYP
ncbi:hypothetical protein jhhlp_004259 [Lomentospora prolificans]|uniref:Ketoreductase domain-containing protein n=1 Tax=Lomentospora prolificans TaxID=41688 RepID=A0A2N3NB29_9PEZI|nr:hypothetical protein jhhlp_004259 [Lomentospora prolificans]